MCGIFGIEGVDPASARVCEALELLKHRGPDNANFCVLDEHIFLGHTRLRIIDLTDAGTQPMCNEDENLWITYNGEIYNFKELQSDLRKRHAFKSQTDTEVILHLYEEKEEECVEYLNGMFALAIYDRRGQRLFLARDRLGIKPLYYAYVNGLFIFASEIKAILATGLVDKEIDWQAIYDYFSFLYIPHPQTAFKSIRQLSPAHYLIFDIKQKDLKTRCYWEPWRPKTDGRENNIYGELKEELRALLEDSVERELISDVPLGLFLSGGIDSTVLAGLMARKSLEPIKTLTVVFTGAGTKLNDDTEYARRVSQYFKTEHREMTIDINMLEALFSLIHYFDQPFGNPTLYLSYLISRVARESVTVALSGAGGDELFGGYPRYKVLCYGKFLQHLPRSLNLPFSWFSECIPEDIDNPLPKRLKRLASGLGQPIIEQILRLTYYFSDETKARLLKPMLLRNSAIRPSTNVLKTYYEQVVDKEELSRVQFVDLKTFLVDNILEYTDKMSMAASLEVRVPFLDYRIVELSFKIPSQYKIRSGESKWILKDTFRDIIPQENISAPKRGFCPPLTVWMEKYFDSYFDDFLTKKYVEEQSILDWSFIQSLRMQHKARKKDNSMGLFGIIIFDVWFRKYICS